MTPLAKAPTMLVKELGRERSFAHASRIGLHNAQNKARRARAKTRTGGGPSVVEGGWITEFQNGMITWTNQGGGSFIETITKN